MSYIADEFRNDYLIYLHCHMMSIAMDVIMEATALGFKSASMVQQMNPPVLTDSIDVVPHTKTRLDAMIELFVEKDKRR